MFRSSVWFCTSALTLIACLHASSSPATASAQTQAPGVAASGAISADDAALARAITSALGRDPVLRSQRVTATASNGIVSLDGSVPSLAVKDRALRLAGTFRGPSAIIDRISVVPPIRPTGAIAQDVESDLRRDPATRSARVNARVVSGTVTLTGTVDSQTQREIVDAVASHVAGIQALDDQLRVAAATQRSDEEIAHDIRQRLADDARLDGIPLRVVVRQGDAEVSGVVSSVATRDAAIGDAWVAGVAWVNPGDLRVDWRAAEQARRQMQPPLPDDKHVVVAVTRALGEDPRLAPTVPAVTASRGIVTLSGTVASNDVRDVADHDALAIRGVWTVDDQMNVAAQSAASTATLQKGAATSHGGRNVLVTTTSGAVTIPGSVTRTWIERDVSGIPGVVGKEEEVEVRSAGPSTPATAADAIRDRALEMMFWDPRVRAGTVSVEVARSGDVTLTGKVETWGEARAAEQDAKQAGASAVKNELRVHQAPGFTPPASAK